MAVATTVQLLLKALETGTGDLSTPSAQHLKSILSTYSTGTGSSQFDKVFSDSRIAAAAVDTIDLLGSLTGALGAVVSFTKLNGILIHNKSETSGQDLFVGGAAANPFFSGLFNAAVDKIRVKPGGILFWLSPIDGVTPTAGTADILAIDPIANTISYDLVLLGRSA
jgi:hypothetical protein